MQSYRRQAEEDPPELRAQVAQLLGSHGSEPSRLPPAFAAATTTLQQAISRWLARTARSEHTRRAYCQALSRILHRLTLFRLADHIALSSERLAAYIDVMYDYSPRSRRRHLAAISSWYGWLIDGGILAKTPATRTIWRSCRYDDAIVMRSTDGQRQALTRQQARHAVRWCLEHAAPDHGLALLLMLLAGMRSAEVATATAERVREQPDGEILLTIIGKGRRSRLVSLSREPELREAFMRCRSQRLNRGPLISGADGKAVTPRTIQRWASMLFDALGLPYSSHALRRTFAQLHAQRGASLPQLKGALGHSSVTTTMLYAEPGYKLDTRIALGDEHATQA
jgi:site-specific recombinase XerD